MWPVSVKLSLSLSLLLNYEANNLGSSTFGVKAHKGKQKQMSKFHKTPEHIAFGSGRFVKYRPTDVKRNWTLF